MGKGLGRIYQRTENKMAAKRIERKKMKSFIGAITKMVFQMFMKLHLCGTMMNGTCLKIFWNGSISLYLEQKSRGGG